jgi:hypothetical protein
LSSIGYGEIQLSSLLGTNGWTAVAADFDGDRKADPAVYGETTGDWKVMLSSAGYWSLILADFLGGAGYIPCPADYDGDRIADPAVKSATGTEWIVMFSSGGYVPTCLVIQFE